MDDASSLLSPEQLSNGQPANGPKRRRRAAIACQDCRTRKTKCDHIAQINSSEEMLKGMTKTAQIYIRSMERRLRSFEERQRDPLPKVSEYQNIPSSCVDSSQVDLTTSNGPSQFLAGSVRPTIISTSPEIFMGGRAGESFTQLILNAMNRAKLETKAFASPRSPNDKQIGDAQEVLSPPRNARELVKVYFDFHHVLTPIFHVPSILAKFEQILSPGPQPQPDQVYTLATMYMVCAIAAAHNRPGLDGSAPTARKHYDTAMQLIQSSLLSDWSLEKVQILLLGARFLQSASYPDECWNVLGLAIRVAYGLDLHRPPPEGLDYISKEVRKRVWYACFGFDQVLSMIYGRPSSTSSLTASTPLPEDLDDDCIQPTRLLYPSVPAPSSMSFFLQVSKLYRILESAATHNQPILENLVKLDEEFEAWQAGLPSNLRIADESQVEDDKSLILALRANMVRILIHRPSLMSVLSSLSGYREQPQPVVTPGRLQMGLLRQSRETCVDTAKETIRLVGKRHEKTKKATGPSWFNLYYLFNAILIIVSHVVDPKYCTDRDALAHLEQAKLMIRQMSANHLCAQRAFTFLQQLLNLLDKTLPDDPQRLSARTDRTDRSNSAEPDVAGQEPSGPLQADEIMPDVLAFWESTHDLTMDLGSQLEMHSALGSGIWSWNVQDHGESQVDMETAPVLQ